MFLTLYTAAALGSIHSRVTTETKGEYNQVVKGEDTPRNVFRGDNVVGAMANAARQEYPVILIAMRSPRVNADSYHYQCCATSLMPFEGHRLLSLATQVNCLNRPRISKQQHYLE